MRSKKTFTKVILSLAIVSLLAGTIGYLSARAPQTLQTGHPAAAAAESSRPTGADLTSAKKSSGEAAMPAVQTAQKETSSSGTEDTRANITEEENVYEQLDEIIEQQAEDAVYEGFVFRLKDDAAEEQVQAIAQAIADGARISRVDYAENTYTAETVEDIKAVVEEKQLAYVEPDYQVYMFGDAVQEVSETWLPQSASDPNDKYYETYQYNIKDLNIPPVWEYGLEGQDFDDRIDMDRNGSFDDDDIVVAVIDSGLKDGHEDIDWDRIVTGISFADGTDSTDTNDTDGHGTFVTGIIAAQKDNEVGTAGILQRAKVMPIRVFNGESASDSTIVNAINYAAAQRETFDSSNGTAGTNIAVINMSLGSSGTSSSMDTACQRAMDAGIIVVCAAGNDGDSTASYPAQYSMGVGSTNNTKTVSSYSQRLSSYNGSNYANKVWVAAPGEAVTSLYCESTKSYAQMSGTSFSSPEVAALGALCKSLKNDMTQEEFMELLKETSDYKKGSSGDIKGQDVEYGWGLVNFKSTVDRLISSQFGEQKGESHLTVRVQNEAGSEIENPFVSIYELTIEDGVESRGEEIAVNEDGTWTLQKGRRYYYAAHAEKYDYQENTFATLTEERTLTITLLGKSYPVAFSIVNTSDEPVAVSSLSVRSVSGVRYQKEEDGTFRLRNGSYVYEIEADNYFDTAGSFVIDDIKEDLENGTTIPVTIRGDRDVCSVQLKVMGDSEDGDITAKAVVELTDAEGTEIAKYKDGDYKLDAGIYQYIVYHDEYKTVKGSLTVTADDIGQRQVQTVSMNGKLYTIVLHIFPLSSEPEVQIYDTNGELYDRQAGVRNASYRNYRLTDGKYYYQVKEESRGLYKGTFTVKDGTLTTKGLKIAGTVIIEASGKRDLTINMQNSSPDTVFTDNTYVPEQKDIVPENPSGEPEHIHKYIGSVTKEPTCTSVGERTWTCEAGDDSYTEEIPKAPHRFDENGVCVVCGTLDSDTIEDEDWLTLQMTDANGEQRSRKVSLTQLLSYQSVKNYTMINTYYGTAVSYTVYGITFRDLLDHFAGNASCVSAMHITAMDISENRDSYGNLYDVDLTGEQMDNAMIAWYTINNSSGEERTGSDENNMRVVIDNGYGNDWMYGPDVLEFTYGDHQYETAQIIAPTCTEEGHTVYACSVCGKTYEGDFVPASGHQFDASKEILTPPTCTRAGFTTHVCDVCGETIIDSYVPAAHQLIRTEAVAPGCETEGRSAYHTCSVCGKYFLEDTAVTEIEQDSWILPAAGHDYQAVWDWAQDAQSAILHLICRNDDAHRADLDAAVTVTRTEPTFAESGSILYTAEAVFDGVTYQDTKEELLEPLGHDYALTDWIWTDDETGGFHAYAVFTDQEDQTVTRQIEAEVTTVETPADCEHGGTIVYTASIRFDGATYEDRQETKTEALGHAYEVTGWKWADDFSSAVLTLTCSHDKTHVETVSAYQIEQTQTKAPTVSAKGSITYTATAAFGGNVYTDQKTQSLPAVKAETKQLNTTAIALAKTAYVYNGKDRKPAVTVKDGTRTLKKGTDYTVSYKNNKNVGLATVTIKGKGSYTGTVTRTFKINPKAVALSKVTGAKKGVTVQWKKAAAQVTGYQIQYSTSKTFQSKKTIKIKSSKTTKKKISKLKAKKTYYVRIRTYRTVGGKTYYSAWTKAKRVKTK